MNLISSFYKNYLDPLFRVCFSTISNISREKIIQERKLNFHNLLYILCRNIASGKGLDTVLTEFHINENINITEPAIIKKRKIFGWESFEKLNRNLIDFIYKNKKNNIYIVDGSFLYVPKYFQKYGYQLCN